MNTTDARSQRYRDALGVVLITASNLLPYRLFRKMRFVLLKLAGVRFEGTTAFILGPIYVQYPSRLIIGNAVFINGNCFFENLAPVRIDQDTMIGPACLFLTNNHHGTTTNEPRPIRIGNGTWIGGGAKILPGVSVGCHSVVGAGAVVTRDVADHQTVVGVPAKPISQVRI